MSDKNKQRLFTVLAVVVAGIILWFLLRANPQLVQTVQRSLPDFNIDTPQGDTFNVNAGNGYDPRNFPLPSINNGGVSIGCSFCSTGRTTTIGNPARINSPASYIPDNILTAPVLDFK